MTAGMNPQWKTVFVTSNTTPSLSLASGDKPIVLCVYQKLNFRSNFIDENKWKMTLFSTEEVTSIRFALFPLGCMTSCSSDARPF